VMGDSTQDVAVMDQLAICVRYVVQGKVYERLLEMTVIDDSSGQALYERITSELAKYGIQASNIVACSFDGASNMKGCYNGLQAHFKKANENMIYTHCMAHVLNLVVADSASKRSGEIATDKLTNVITVFKEISDGNFDCKSRYMARNLASQWAKFENLFISFVLLDMFLVITPVSKYLQTKTLDYAIAWDLVQTLLKQINEKRNDKYFEFLYTKTKEYATAVNSKLEDSNIDLELQLDFTERRISKKKRMPGEQTSDDAPEISAAQHF
uniref:Uncharacterized protein LOC114349311 n=1 Tax=Diabrotica virgifera virgifera TaxID=50390 RepID=A0A6P7H0E8_DIAVI